MISQRKDNFKYTGLSQAHFNDLLVLSHFLFPLSFLSSV